ncbi:MAG: hypothetical protein EXR87_04895 [Gammaproteobacteria bacterium]|nr:hypothetical protein [Gammaproteobacteria bacterium]
MNDNAVVVEAWNTVLFDKFSRFKHLIAAGLSGHSDELLSRRLFRAGNRVLDIGCGFGDSTLRIASEIRPTGQAVGVDGVWAPSTTWFITARNPAGGQS